MSVPVAQRDTTGVLNRPYVVLGLVSAGHAVTHMYSALMPLVYPHIIEEFHISYGELGLMLGVSGVVGGLLQLAVGIGGRYIARNVLLGLSHILLGASIFFTGFATNFTQFSALRWATSIAQTPQHPVANSLIADLFPRKLRGSAFAINFAGGNVGTVIVPGLAIVAIAALGWRNTMFLFAIPAFLMGFVLTWAIRDRREVEPPTDGTSSKTNLKQEIKSVFGNRTFMLLMAASTIAAGGRGIGVVMTYVPLYLQKGLVLDPGIVGFLFTILMIGSIIGPLIMGRASDRFGRRPAIVASYLAAAVFTVIFVNAPTEAPILAANLILVGIAVYSQPALLQSFVADAVGTSSRDVAFGMFFAIAYGAGAIWSTILGTAIDHFGFSIAFYFMAVSYVGAVLCLLLVRERPHRSTRESA